MNMKDVKAITIPQGSVKKIEDSNGNIIWGSYDAFPYELLEYIDIPAGCYIDLNNQGSSTLGCYLDVNWNINNDTISGTGYPFGSIYRSGSTYYRYHLARSSTALTAWYANNSSTTLTTSDLNSRSIIELNFHTYNDNKAYCDNVEKGTFSPTSGTNTGSVYLGGRRFNDNGTVTINDYQHTMRVYSLKIQSGANALSIFYPAKRKSDGKIGLLKIYNNGQAISFRVTETNTEPTAGPVVDEYWDLTA